MSNPEFRPEEFDKILCSQARLAIISLLFKGDEVDFVFLREKLGLSEGNLSAHLRTLEEAGFIKIKKSFFERKPRTTYKITHKGQKHFIQYVNMLEKIIEGR